MKRFVWAAALLLAAAPVEVAPDDTYSVKVTVSGMSWPDKWGGAIKDGLAGLDGSAKVEQVSFKKGTGVYTVTLPDKAKFESAKVKKAVGSFKLDSVELKIAGDVSKDDKGLWLTAPSGTKLLLANRPKKDDNDRPPDVVAEIEKAMKEGKTTFSVAGAVKEEKDVTTVQLENASAVEKRKEGM